MKYPLVAPLAAFAAGIVAAQYAAFSFRELSISILLLLALALAGLLRGAPRAGSAACLTGFVLAGALWASLPVPSDPNLITSVVDRTGMDLREPVLLRGWVRVPPTVGPDRDQFVLAVESIGDGTPVSGGVRVTAARRPSQPPLDLGYGERVAFPARLRRLRNYQNPGGFDRVAFLLRRDMHMIASTRPANPLVRLPGAGGNSLTAAVWRARHWSERRIDDLLGANSTQAALVKAMLLGNRAYLDRALGLSFQRTGTAHALVISGLHVGVLAWFFLSVFRWLRISSGWSALATMIPLAAFVLLAGSGLPAVRAASMVGAYLVARHFYRQRRALNIIAGAALGMLLFDPSNLFDVSFQLSFLSVALIAGVALPLLERTLQPYRLALVDLPNVDRDLHLPPKVAQTRIEWRLAADRLPFHPRISMAILGRLVGFFVAAGELAVVSASIQIGLALPMAIYFHRISWSGLSANLAVVPLISLIVPAGIVAIVTGWPVLGKLVAALTSALVAVVEWHAQWTWLEARVPVPPPWFSFLFAAVLVAFAWSIGKRKIAAALAGLLLLGAVAGLMLHPFPARLEPGRLALNVLDVGQGDALFLTLPQGRTMLVDGGGLVSFGNPSTAALDIGEDVVSPYLWSRSIRTIDVMAVSHAHYDHIGGLPALLENFQVRELWVGRNPASPQYRRVLETAHRRGARLVSLAAGDVRSLGGVTFQVFSPPRDYAPGRDPSNDDSLVLVARFGERSFLLAGDIERKSERRLAEENSLPRVDVLKVPHHGSKTSANDFFLAATNPWLALVSAGSDNSYGHPHPDVLARLSRHNARVFRTDRDGLVTVSTDGRRVFVSTYQWEKEKPRAFWVE